MQKIIAYEMICNKAPVEEINIECVLFHKDYWKDYMQIYNECFYKIKEKFKNRASKFLFSFSQMREKTLFCMLKIVRLVELSHVTGMK